MKYLPILILLTVCLSVRILYAWAKPLSIVAPDTYGYYLIGQRIIHKTVPVFNDERTPVYPLFLNAIMYLAGSFDAPIFSQEFHKGASYVTAVQALLGIVGYLLLFRLIYELTHVKTFSLILTLILSLNNLHFGWERVLTAESVTFFWLSLLFYVSMHYIKNPSFRILSILFVLFIIGFLLKPLFIGIPFLVLPILLRGQGIVKMLAVSGVVLFIYSSIPFAYIKTNVQRKNYHGINHVSDVNMLGKILEYRIPVSISTPYTKLSQAITAYQHMNGNPDPYAFFSWYEPDLLDKDDTKLSLNQLRYVTMATVKSNLVPYITYSMVQIPSILVRSPDMYVPVKPGDKGFPLWNVLQMLFRSIQYSTFLIIACFLHALSIFLKKRGKQSALTLLICTVFFYQLIMIALFAFTAEEYGRLTSPMMPFVYGTIACWVYIHIFHYTYAQHT